MAASTGASSCSMSWQVGIGAFMEAFTGTDGEGGCMATVILALGSVLCTIVGEAFRASCTGAWGSVLGAIGIFLGSGVVAAFLEMFLLSRLTPKYGTPDISTLCHGWFAYFDRTSLMLSGKV